MVSFLTQTKETHFLGSYSKIPLLIAREDFIPLLFHNPRASVSFKRKILTLVIWGRKKRAQVVLISVNWIYTAQMLCLPSCQLPTHGNSLEHFGVIAYESFAAQWGWGLALFLHFPPTHQAFWWHFCLLCFLRDEKIEAKRGKKGIFSETKN